MMSPCQNVSTLAKCVYALKCSYRQNVLEPECLWGRKVHVSKHLQLQNVSKMSLAKMLSAEIWSLRSNSFVCNDIPLIVSHFL